MGFRGFIKCVLNILLIVLSMSHTYVLISVKSWPMHRETEDLAQRPNRPYGGKE